MRNIKAQLAALLERELPHLLIGSDDLRVEPYSAARRAAGACAWFARVRVRGGAGVCEILSWHTMRECVQHGISVRANTAAEKRRYGDGDYLVEARLPVASKRPLDARP